MMALHPGSFRASPVVVALGIWLAASDGAMAQALLELHQSRGLTCISCHAESLPQKAPASSKCADCHGDEAAVANRTSNKTPNPHAPPHLAPGETQNCEECHHVHKPSEVTCTDCHHSFNFDIK